MIWEGMKIPTKRDAAEFGRGYIDSPSEQSPSRCDEGWTVWAILLVCYCFIR